MAIVQTLDGKLYDINDKLLEGKEVDPANLPQLPKSLPPPAEAGDVQGHGHGHGHWYNWHNHQWHDHHWHDHHHH